MDAIGAESPLPQSPLSRGVLVACLMTLAAMIIALKWEGRVWFCGCGNWSPWISDVESPHCSQHMFDAYSSSHVLHGVLIFAGLWPLRGVIGPSWRLWGCVVLEAAWEVLENSPLVIDRYRTATIALGYTGDSLVNSVCDVASCAAGYWLAGRVPWKWSVAFFAAVELVLLVWIRDSLVLNVLMLVCPLDVVRQWQLGGSL